MEDLIRSSMDIDEIYENNLELLNLRNGPIFESFKKYNLMCLISTEEFYFNIFLLVIFLKRLINMTDEDD